MTLAFYLLHIDVANFLDGWCVLRKPKTWLLNLQITQFLLFQMVYRRQFMDILMFELPRGLWHPLGSRHRPTTLHRRFLCMQYTFCVHANVDEKPEKRLQLWERKAEHSCYQRICKKGEGEAATCTCPSSSTAYPTAVLTPERHWTPSVELCVEMCVEWVSGVGRRVCMDKALTGMVVCGGVWHCTGLDGLNGNNCFLSTPEHNTSSYSPNYQAKQ
eukprot:3384084-Rhodomonas_salina.1